MKNKPSELELMSVQSRADAEIFKKAYPDYKPTKEELRERELMLRRQSANEILWLVLFILFSTIVIFVGVL